MTQQRAEKENKLKSIMTCLLAKAEKAARETRVSLRVLDQIRGGREIAKISQTAWTSALIAAIDRNELNCPICFEPHTGDSELLSCSHTFHSACISACENVSARICPICRQTYSRVKLSDLN
jgi:hypothetical protein